MGLVVLLVFAVTLVVAAGYCAGIYNQLIGVKINVDKSWSNIEVPEKQRYDEIPTLQKVIAARTKYLAARGPSDKAAAGGEMAGALKSLFALAESYPDLKANQN